MWRGRRILDMDASKLDENWLTDIGGGAAGLYRAVDLAQWLLFLSARRMS
jgi:hypothetical protein